MNKKVSEMEYNEVGFSKTENKYFLGSRHRNSVVFKDTEIEILPFANDDNNYTTLDSLLNGSFAEIHGNTYQLKEMLSNPQGVLCCYAGRHTKNNQQYSKWDFVQPLGIGYYDSESKDMHFDCVGSINYPIG